MIPEQRRRGRHRPEAITSHDRRYVPTVQPWWPLVVGSGKHRVVTPAQVAGLHEDTWRSQFRPGPS